MAERATVVTALPVIHVERGDVDLAQQRLLPSSDRRNVVELWRVRAQREFEELLEERRS